MWRRVKMLIINRRLQELLDDLVAAEPGITRILNIRYLCWLLLFAGAIGNPIVLVAQPFVALGMTNTATSTTYINNTAPAGGDGSALYVQASLTAGGTGLQALGSGSSGFGVHAFSFDAVGVLGVAVPSTRRTSTNGVTGISWNPDASGVYGENSGNGFGVAGRSLGRSIGGSGVLGDSPNGTGVYGISTNSNGVQGFSTNWVGVYGSSLSTYGGFFSSASGQAGYFNGNVHVAGTLTKGAGAFKIDHPLDPANKYLSHSFVESPDMKTIYDGVVVLDANGETSVELPAWFEALNRDFRYQLTAIGAAAPNLYVAEKISKNRFKIAGGPPGLEVSWQVTGIRHDPYAEQHRIRVEEQKSAEERGKYLYPKEHGQPTTMGINYA